MARGARPFKQRVARFGLNEHGEPVDTAVEGFLELLLTKSPFKLRAFVVFGSRARGDWKPWSDTDVLLIMDGIEGKTLWEVMRELSDVWDGLRGLPLAGIEPRIFTPGEFSELLRRRTSLTVLDALEEGVVLYDDGFWRGVRAEFEEMKKKGLVEKTPTGWKVSWGE